MLSSTSQASTPTPSTPQASNPAMPTPQASNPAMPIIIGAGLAGLSAALSFARAGQACHLVSPQESERAQSVMAEGGINAALDLMGQGDTPAQHFADSWKSAAAITDPNALFGMCEGAPDVVRDLIGLGVPFQVEQGHMIQRPFGGQSKKRTCYVKSSTGKALVGALIDALRRYEAEGLVIRRTSSELVALDVDEKRCVGAWLCSTRTKQIEHLEGPVVLATGGFAGIFGPSTTGSTTNTGDITALVFSQGVKLANLEFIQYHPTTIAIPGKRMLVSEAARGEGGRLFVMRDGAPWYFMEERYPELGNLMPRDVVSREIASVMADPSCENCVFLDMREVDPIVWSRRLGDLRDECIRLIGIDPATEPLPVEPGIHYSMGGIWVDEQHRCSMGGLFAAGECACQYHGANRLGGNSLLGAIYGGKRAAQTVLDELAQGKLPIKPTQPLEVRQAAVAFNPGIFDISRDEVEREQTIQEILATHLGIVRDEKSLLEGIEQLLKLDVGNSVRLRRRVLLAHACMACAITRIESRGAHCRSDYPDTNESLAEQSVVWPGNGAVVFEFRPLPGLRAESRRVLQEENLQVDGLDENDSTQGTEKTWKGVPF
ncbi:MAG: FAD-binding protein [Atopobiaceae bacterium]|nr:FAD-binding protein [Atopobiaceae bacterium]